MESNYTKLSLNTQGSVAAFIGIFFLICGISILGWQIFHWLDTGDWVPVPMLVIVEWLARQSTTPTAVANNLAWVAHPKSWIGLWKVLNWFPVSLASFLCAVFAALTTRSP